MTPRERIEEIYDSLVKRKRPFWTSGDTKYDALVQYLDEQAELLEAHTENEPKAHKPNTCTCPCHNKHATHYHL